MPIPMKDAKVKNPNPWTTSVKPFNTAREILDKIIAKNKRDRKLKVFGRAYKVREFSKVLSLDAHGNEVISPIFQTNDSYLENIASTNDAVYHDLCYQIELTVGVPHLAKASVDASTYSIVPRAHIYERLEKYKKREKFELKSLREMCSSIDSSLNIATKSALNILRWLYNDNGGRPKQQILNELYKSLYLREKDKLFYIRRHPTQVMLHRCNNEAILERIKHLNWVFIDGNPFKKIKRETNASSTLT